MKREKYLIESTHGLELLGLQEYSRRVTRNEQIKYIGKVQHVRKKTKEPSNMKLLKKRLLEKVKENITILANKGEKNLLINFKYVISKL